MGTPSDPQVCVRYMRLHCKNYVDGQWRDSESGRTYAVQNPADLRREVHRYPLTTPVEVLGAIEGASRAFGRWRAAPLTQRTNVLRRAAMLIRERRAEIAAVVTAENGKLLSESLMEIDAAALELDYQVGEGERQFGRSGDGYRQQILAYSRKEPVGVVSVIVPWNFPFNVPWRKLGPALMAGNAAIFKPASQTPGVGEAVVQILIDAGLPSGVVQFLTGSGSELSEALVAHPLIRAITFTGSTEVGRRIAELAAHNFARTQLELGGKNPMVVLRDADLALASQDALIGAFSCAGQWCTATSRLIVEEAVADDLTAALLRLIRNIRLGPGTDTQSTMGPVSGEHQLRSVLKHLSRAHTQGAHFATGGDRCELGELTHGCFIEPSLIVNGSEELDAAREEIFGPVLTIFRVSNYAEALRLANAVPYGLSSSIYTRDLERALHFVQHTEVGLTHVNVHTAFKEPQQCFGGVKESGFGLPEAGSTGLQFFQEEKSIYIRKGPVSAGAQRCTI